MRSFLLPAGMKSMLQFIEQWEAANPGKRLSAAFDEEKRTLTRNAQLHAVLTDISEQLDWHGQFYDIEDWKRMLTAGWMRATNRMVKLVPAVDGSGVDVLYQRTSRLTEAECRELIQYIYAWGVDQNVKFKDPHEEAA